MGVERLSFDVLGDIFAAICEAMDPQRRAAHYSAPFLCLFGMAQSRVGISYVMVQHLPTYVKRAYTTRTAGTASSCVH